MAKQYREGSSFTRYVCTVSQKDEKTDTTWQDVTSKPHIYISIYYRLGNTGCQASPIFL